MPLADDFWWQLHLLHSCVETSDGNGDDRRSRIVANWEAMPLLAREVSAAELSQLLGELGRLGPLVGNQPVT